MPLAEEELPGPADRFIGPAGNVIAIVVDGDLSELLAARRWIAARDAGLAEIPGLEADRPGNCFHRQITQGIRSQPSAHTGLDLRRQRTVLKEICCEQLADRRHVDPIETGRDDRWAGHADVDLTRQTRLPDPLQQDL